MGWSTDFGEEVCAEETGDAEGGGDEDYLEGGVRADEKILWYIKSANRISM